MKKASKAEDIITAAVARLDEAVTADRDNRDEAMHDLEMLAGQQWPESIRQEREAENRPCLTINRLPQFTRQVTGDIRRMNPSINVIPGDGEASSEVAEIIEGLVRQIQYQSDAPSVYENAGESAASCGMGFFRIVTEYEGHDTFDQRVTVKPIYNPFSVYCDPTARMPTREDADWWFITDKIKADDFKEKYPDASLMDVEADQETDGLSHWMDGDNLIIAEYFWKEPETYTIGITDSGQVIKNPVAPVMVVKKREVQGHKVMWAKISGKDVLEGPTEIPSMYLPVVAVMGEELQLSDRVRRNSVIRFAKDPQQLYNYWRSAQTELVALQPKAPYLVTAKQIQGLESFWNAANDSNRPYLPYNPDEKAPGAPKRAQPPVSSQGMMQEVMTAAEDLKGTTGIYDAGLGGSGNETSGVAIRQRQMESDISTSIYSDNMAKAVAHAGRIVVDMIPRVYDSNRILRILGKDDSEKMIEVNGLTQTIEGPQHVNPLTIGKYDVKIKVGPNYTTRRQEAAESMLEFVRAVPQAGNVAGDLIAKNMDWPGADDLADRLKKMLPPEMRNPEDMSPEEQQQIAGQMQQAQMAAQIQQQMAEIEMAKSKAEANEAMSDAEKAKFEAMSEQMEFMAKTGALDDLVSQRVQEEVNRAISVMMTPRY